MSRFSKVLKRYSSTLARQSSLANHSLTKKKTLVRNSRRAVAREVIRAR